MTDNINQSSGTPATSKSNTSFISEFAQNICTTENVAAAGSFAKQEVLELKQRAEDGDRSMRFLALLGGIACVVVGVFEMFSRFLRFQFVGVIIDLYIIVLGIIVVILEGKNTFLSQRFIQYIHKYALFLKYLWGRGALLLFIGTIKLYEVNIINLIVGIYMCCLGILHIVVGYRTTMKLKSARKSFFPDSTLKQKFDKADTDNDGGLNLDEFRVLCIDLGMDLNGRETEAAFRYMTEVNTDTNNTGKNNKLRFEPFRDWWNESSDIESQMMDEPLAYVVLT